MNIVGVSCYYHDAAAALIMDGVVIAAAEEERFTRRKHDSAFPANALRFCLEHAGLGAEDIDLAVHYEKPLRKLERALVASRPHGERADRLLAWDLANYVHREARLAPDIRAAVGLRRDGRELPVEYCEHHLAHAASVFYVSPFEEAAILTIDGVGEWATTALFVGGPNGISQLKEIRYPNSIGLFYATMTSFLGFEVNDGEYKVMGLASYGAPIFEADISRLMTLHEDGGFRNTPEYFSYAYDDARMFTDALTDLLGPARRPAEPVTQRHMDIAASVQMLCEAAVINLARAARRETGLEALCLAGGVAQNVVANSRVLAEGGFSRLFIQPASGDSGGAIGGALQASHQRRAAPRIAPARYDTCLGPAFANDRIEAALQRFGADYEAVDPADLPARVARLLADDLVVGWFQGRMEFGPRALGCRSILANAGKADMKDILNARIKFRETFRPFAPAVLEEAAAEYFDLAGPSPHMLFCPPVLEAKRRVIPAVTHVDGTARVQTVSRDLNPRFHDLIGAFAAITGVPVIINTSFNVKGEPIVCTPEDALRCFYRTEIDFLAIGDFLVGKGF